LSNTYETISDFTYNYNVLIGQLITQSSILNTNYYNKTSVSGLISGLSSVYASITGFSSLTNIYGTITTTNNLITSLNTSLGILSNNITLNYYNITGVNTLLNNTETEINNVAGNLSNNYYTKTNIDSLINSTGVSTLSNNLNTLSNNLNNNYYNKVSVNGLFSGLTSIYETITATNLLNTTNTNNISNLTNIYQNITGFNTFKNISLTSILSNYNTRPTILEPNLSSFIYAGSISSTGVCSLYAFNVGVDKYLQLGLSYPLTEGAGHTLVYDLSSTSKSLLNNAVQSTTLSTILANYNTQASIVSLEPNLSSSIYPASINGSNCNIYAFGVGSGHLKIDFAYPLTQGAGHTVSYDSSDGF